MMRSLFTARAIEDAACAGNAILKFISANEVGATGSHQCGFYLPRAAWPMYTPHPPEKGTIGKHAVHIEWPDGSVTESVITWYGRGTRAEYRLTRFGRACPWLAPDSIGNLLMLVPRAADRFAAWVFDREQDIEDVEAALGISLPGRWGVYRNGSPDTVDQDECLAHRFRRYAQRSSAFPSGEEMSVFVQEALTLCQPAFGALSPDDQLLRLAEAEYSLYRELESQLCGEEIRGPFDDVDSFLQTAARVMNRRKSRAGRSLENHVEYLLSQAHIPHKMRPAIDGEPDIVVPSERAYFDPAYPAERLFIIGVKTTCKDRWRQVLNEGRRARRKYIVTLQPGISAAQLREMNDCGISLVVPEKLHSHFPKTETIELLSVTDFVTCLRRACD